MQNNTEDLHWKFDISTFRLLGRELITDRITALVELVKNAYDANAENVYINFYNTSSLENGKIVIQDDGFGMSADDIKNKWMKIGTDSKRKNKFSPKPFSRRVVGEKGIGRFAIDKLGANCKILSKTQESDLNLLTIDWTDYESNQKTDDFNAVGNKLRVRKFNSEWSGVKISTRKLNDIWTKDDLTRAYKELAKIVSPFNELYPPFNIYIYSNEFDTYNTKPILVENKAIKYASETFSLEYNLSKDIQEHMKFQNNALEVVEIPLNKLFGPIKFKLYYFDQYAKGNFSKSYKGSELQIDGIKIYRDGILTTPFAENEATRDKRRDILGIDKRRWSGFFDKIGSRDILGIVEIQKDLSPNIIDATNRQDFINNESYSELKVFIIEQISELEKYLKFKKQEVYKNVDKGLEEAKNSVEQFSENLKELKKDIKSKDTIDIEEQLKSLEKSARDANIALKKGLNQQEEERKATEQKETMFMSLMPLQLFALELTHIIKTSLSHIKQRAEFNIDFYNDKSFDQLREEYNHEIMKEIDKLVLAIDFMSKYTRSGENWKEFNVKESILSVFNSYRPILEKENIKTIIEVQDNITLNYNNILFEDIIINLLNNSVNALETIKNKIVKVAVYSEDNILHMTFSDNGKGVENKIKDTLFEIWATTTSEIGGNGMGLYMIQTNLNAIKGNIELSDSELENGATFKLQLPFKG